MDDGESATKDQADSKSNTRHRYQRFFRLNLPGTNESNVISSTPYSHGLDRHDYLDYLVAGSYTYLRFRDSQVVQDQLVYLLERRNTTRYVQYSYFIFQFLEESKLVSVVRTLFLDSHELHFTECCCSDLEERIYCLKVRPDCGRSQFLSCLTFD